MNIYLKCLFFYFLLQNVWSENSFDFAAFTSNSSTPAITGLIENNSTLLNETYMPAQMNCSQGLDSTKCNPINITLSYECTKVNYDFLIYSTVWQPKFCYQDSKNCKPSDHPKWRIQGLKGTFINGTRPIQCCSDKQLHLNEISSILPDLREKWSYEQDSSVEDNIIEDWNLHGSCVQESEGKNSVQLYRDSMNLNARLPIEQWLSNARIEPSNVKKYGLQFFNYTISSKLDKKFQLRCKTFDYDKRISIIDTINFCVDRKTLEVIDCPMELSFDSNCLEMVYYPNNLLEYKVPDEVFYRDMNYYRYNNYHRSYSPFMYGHSYGSNGLLTGAAIGASGATAALALPAAYYYFKNLNKKNKFKNHGGYSSFGPSMPWYASTAYGNTFASPSNYGTPKNFGNFGHNYNMNNNLYPRQSYPSHSSPNFLPPTVYSGIQNNPKSFGNLNVADLSPAFYNSKLSQSNYLNPAYSSYNSNSHSSYPSYLTHSLNNSPYPSNIPNYPPPKYTATNTGGLNPPPSYPGYQNSGLNPSYPAYASNNNKQSYPSYPPGNLPQAPPPYSKADDKNSHFKQSSYDKPPSYSSIDKSKPSYPSYPKSDQNAYKPSAPSLHDLNDKPKSSNNLYPKLPNDKSKYSPSAPSYPSYSSSGSKPSSSSPSKPKSTGIFGSLFSKITGGSKSNKSGGSSYGRSGSSRSSGGRGFGGSRSRG